MQVGYFALKSDAITAKAAAEKTIDAYIYDTFPVGNKKRSLEEKRILTNWWKDERKREKSLIIKEDGLLFGITLDNRYDKKYVS